MALTQHGSTADDLLSVVITNHLGQLFLCCGDIVAINQKGTPEATLDAGQDARFLARHKTEMGASFQSIN